GAAQFLGVGMITAGAGLAEIAAATFLLNLRHMVYGLSFLELYKGAGCRKPYLILTLTDETYALLSTISVPPGVDPVHFRFCVSALNQSYWLLGTTVGALIGGFARFDTRGMEFSLTALFVVLLVEQTRKVRQPLPYMAAAVCAAAAYLALGPSRMLLPAIGGAGVLLFILRGRLERRG
ncbi:MAG TPA: AzlC family ABC transporter permease, partial [Magnetospirillaceae bacterium]|nr:AzlC family ABC transporter permease [Magnetospirillaceae bacterium]